MLSFFFFFFKQKTAYEMRISDWSSDVCSSDLIPVPGAGQVQAVRGFQAQGVDVVDEHQKAGEFHGFGDAEFLGRLDRIDKVAAGVGQRQHLCFGRLGLQQERGRSEEHTSELQSLMRSSYAVFCLKKKKNNTTMKR